MVHDNESESLEEAFEKHEKGHYRPHKGPSGDAFEQYKEGGQSRDKPSHSTPPKGANESLEATYSPGIMERISSAFFGSEEASQDDYVDLGEEIDGEHGAIDPSQYNVPEVQGWIDEQLEQGDTQMVDRVLAAERQGDQRTTVLNYVNDSDLSDEKTVDDLEFFDSKDEFQP